MTTLLQAAKQVLKALEASNAFVEASANEKLLPGWGEQLDLAELAAADLRQAIVAAEQNEPTAWALWMPSEAAPRQLFLSRAVSEAAEARWDAAYTGCLHVPLYTYPVPQQTPLDEAAIARAWAVAEGEHNASSVVKRRITRAIEAAHRIGVPL